jgi:hypothetical protein
LTAGRPACVHDFFGAHAANIAELYRKHQASLYLFFCSFAT